MWDRIRDNWGFIATMLVLLCVLGCAAIAAWVALSTRQRVEEIARHLGLVSKPLRSGDESPQRVAEKPPVSG